jgi:hypothetical protein
MRKGGHHAVWSTPLCPAGHLPHTGGDHDAVALCTSILTSMRIALPAEENRT